MSYTETHIITVTKPAKRNLQAKVIEANVTDWLSGVNNKSRAARGWTLERNAPEGQMNCWQQRPGTETDYEYDVSLVAKYDREDGKTPQPGELTGMVKTLNAKCSQPVMGKWAVSKVDGIPYVEVEGSDRMDNTDLGYAEAKFPADWRESFSHLFGLDSHITRVKKALDAAMQSGWRNRFHVALIGAPGCGKSDLAETFRKVLGTDAVWKLDGTATTQAGAIKELDQMEILPRVIIIEEIEKAPEATMTFLLGVLDTRAEIRKTTARGNIQRETKCFCIATVNDLALFNKLQSGALSSRFANKIFFRRPDRDMLGRILRREIAKVQGNEKWITPVLDLADELVLTDPREVIAHCLCGQDDLLNGKYQEMLKETAEYSGEVMDLDI